MTNKKKYRIYDRALDFAALTALLVNKLPRTQAAFSYGRQLIESSGSIGANIEEADGALTKKDFINKLGISRRESRESRHWLALIGKVGLIFNKQDLEELEYLVREATEILLILSSIINNTKNG
jgi:four helix bundle protein